MELHLDRLTLRLSGVSAADGRRLVELVGDGLAAATPPATGGGAPELRVVVAAHAGESLDALAARIVADLVQSIARSVP